MPESQNLHPRPAPGRVYLVGAGPGDPGLLTLRGLECLRRAELVLYDGLVNPLLLRHTQAACERTARVEGTSGRRLDQAEINRRLVEAALSGRTVVRLKGGDPYIFGRGSEEAAALQAAGIPYEVVPGVTAATAAAITAGLSLTHRDHASAVAFITGHEDPDKPESALDYAALVRFPGTLVFYMGLRRIGEITRSLVEHGRDPATPAVVVCRASWPDQRVVEGALVEISDAVQRADLHAPSLVIVGECVRQRAEIDWFSRRPLIGQRIGVTRPEGQVDSVIDRIVEQGGDPVLLPTIEIAPVADPAALDAELARLSSYDWLVFSSVNGVDAVFDRLWAIGGDVRQLGQIQLAVIGAATQSALAQRGLRADLVPAEFRAEALAAALSPHVAGRRVLWARASRGRDVLPTTLRAAGAEVTELICYQNLDVAAWPESIVAELRSGGLDWVGLSSPSIARNLARLWPVDARGQLGTRTRLAAISPVTAAAAAECGLPVHVVATEYTWNGLIDAIAAAAATSC